MTNILNKKIGIVGGGQLGKMMIQAAKQMGFWIAIIDPTEKCPAHSLSDFHIVAGLDDKNAIKELAALCDVITYESEHINAEALIELEEKHGATIYPSPKSLKIIQNKYDQKTELHKNNVAIPYFLNVTDSGDLPSVGNELGYPFMLKSATGGYDGKGNYLINSPDDFDEGYKSLGAGTLPLMAEKFVDYEMEISVIACRAICGNIKVFPVGHNTHVNSILDETIVPAPINKQTMELAMDTAHKVMEVFEGVGIFCVEMFVDKKGDVLVNEVAPRPHNSGHYTIEACVTSQFEQHIRAICGLPLGDASLTRPVAMINILGEEGFDGETLVEGVSDALAVKGAKLHIYGKTHTKPRRKMGHITATADTVEEAAKLCRKAKKCIKIIAKEE
ncbi:MAG: 5-(carboxyamino)imidazole ribonucleotide synthase [Defluviitaleaceae bacterium]|nr:5-(carboxyamino)imidazole ribonucleotide synthase [Defluviitaleaceae bacterium]